MKFNENHSKGTGDMERTRKSYGRKDRLMNRQTKGIPVTPILLRGGGLIRSNQVNLDNIN